MEEKGTVIQKEKKGRKIERKKEKETKTTQNNKRGEKKGEDEKIAKRDSGTQSTKYLKRNLS